MKTDWYAEQLLRLTFRDTPLPLPVEWHIAASTEPFDSAAVGTALDEGLGAGYERALVPRASTHWSTVTLEGGVLRIANSRRILWPGAVADWLPVYSLYLCDAAAGGNAFYGADLDVPIVVPTGQALSLPAGTAVFTER